MNFDKITIDFDLWMDLICHGASAAGYLTSDPSRPGAMTIGQRLATTIKKLRLQPGTPGHNKSSDVTKID